MSQCLSAREIAGFLSLHLRNYLTVMDNNKTKLPGRFGNKCFSEWSKGLYGFDESFDRTESPRKDFL